MNAFDRRRSRSWLLPALDRDRGPALPPLRPRRRGRKTVVYARARAVRHARSTSRWWSGSARGSDATTRSSPWWRPWSWRSRSSRCARGSRGSRTGWSTASARRRTRCCPSSPNASAAPTPTRTCCRGWRGARRGHRRRARRRLARGRPGAARRGGVADGRRRRRARSRSRTARCRTIEGMDRVYPVEQAGELLGALAVRKPPSDPVSPVGREADRRPRVPGRTRAAQRPADRGAQGAAGRPEGRAEAAGLGAGRGAPPAGAQHPRRRAAAAGGARREARLADG